MKYIVNIFRIIFLLFITLEAQCSVIDVTPQNTSLLEKSEIFIDKGGKFSFNNIQKAPFQKSNTDFISRGYTQDEAVWLRFSLSNPTQYPITRMLHIDNSMLDSITLYNQNGKEINIGALNRPPLDGIIDFYFPLTLKAQTTEEYYLRVLSNSCAIYFHLTAETKDILWEKNLKRIMILTFFLSLIITLAIYNSFIYLFTQERVYLYYVLFLLMVSYNHFFSYTGTLLPIFYFLGLSDTFIQSYTQIDAYLGIYYMSMIEIFFILFFMELVHTKRFFYIHRVFQGFIALIIVLTFITAIGIYYFLDLIVELAVLVFLVALGVIIYLIYKKEENSFYLLVGLGANIFGHFVFLFFNFGIYIPTNGYWYFYEMSLAIEALLFSVVLSRKLNHTKALASALNTQQILIRELHHRVKNNLQFIVSLYRLKLRPYLDFDGRKKLSEAEGNIHSIGKIHEILYAHQNIEKLDASAYLEDLLKEIKRGYPKRNLTITTKSDMSLKVDDAIYCGLIVNELVTNAIKYAFEPDEKGEVFILLEQNGKDISLKISDNGKGFEWEAHKTSFGLSLVERLVKDELHGTLEFSSQKGSTITIHWS